MPHNKGNAEKESLLLGMFILWNETKMDQMNQKLNPKNGIAEMLHKQEWVFIIIVIKIGSFLLQKTVAKFKYNDK